MSHKKDRPSDVFPTTRWSLIVRAGDSGRSNAAEALSQLLTRYLPALRANLIRMRGIAPERAEDLLQVFISQKFIEENLAEQANPVHGKFRTYLLTILERFLVSEARRDTTLKRGGGEAPVGLTAVGEGPVAAVDADAFDVAWARELLNETIRRVEEECCRNGREALWGVLESRVLRPILEGDKPVEYTQLVARYGFASPSQASNALMTAKRLFQKTLRSVVGEYADSPEAIDDEICDLWSILSKAGAGS